MLADLFMALGRGFDQLTYWCHTYLPFNRWRGRTDEVVSVTQREAARYGLEGAVVDRRRAYQVARMVVENRHGDHLVDLLPDAYGIYAPTSCARTQSGKKKFAPRAERRDAFRRHPQTLAYLLTPPSLARRGLGGSTPGAVVVAAIGEPTPPAGVIASRLRRQLGDGDTTSNVDDYAHVVARLHAGTTAEEVAA
ncbi:MAG: hypothetical protein ACE5HV_05525 [Acidobacteriota bacterium]